MTNDKYNKKSKESIIKYAQSFEHKTIRQLLSSENVEEIEKLIIKYKNRRKGLLGDLVEQYLFGIKNNSDARPDFNDVGIELKTTPLKKNKKNKFSAKERLVFSMIDYMTIINEKWEESSFLKKNSQLLLVFYIYEELISLLDYEFKIVKYLDLLNSIENTDIEQIKNDWNTIVDKIRKGEAHLLSEGDTLYLGAATKASKGTDRRSQPNNNIPAKPRAFSLKTTYLNFLIQKFLNLKEENTVSLFDDKNLPKTIEDNVQERFSSFIGKTNFIIEEKIGISYEKRPKNHRRLLINKLLGSSKKASNRIEEFEKANITMRVIALENSGKLVESISFPIFRYTEIVNEEWEESSFYEQLTTKKFLFVVFRKTKEGDVLEKIKFWNFPMQDIGEAKWVWEETVSRIKNKKADSLPTIKENRVSHVRPHGKNAKDTLDTGYGTKEVKKCFWLNAKYIEKELQG